MARKLIHIENTIYGWRSLLAEDFTRAECQIIKAALKGRNVGDPPVTIKVKGRRSKEIHDAQVNWVWD